VDACVTMVNEQAFTDNKSQWEAYKTDKKAYAQWVQDKIAARPERSHGFRYKGQYKEELAKAGGTQAARTAAGAPAGASGGGE
jgi:hypothetical protein